ncbi:MAG: PTS sugar transporter subunit IIA [Planctomycetota bacterium]|jgi:mannitol/fructose-specific phosphotransferase system IIA component (Ntr-type)|nr:PTS sugar transporter subunit IIA [Planctomycetota bacterium]MDP6941696.1 PTS sugar transporter subunit IIA [Planctomycetota bacterium]
MPLTDFLVPDCILLAPKAKDKWDLLEQMVQQLTVSGSMPVERFAETHQALVAREHSVSTGMEDGIAVPHAALPGLDGVRAAMALIPQGIDFHSLDGKPATIVVLLLVPREEKLQHVRTLTEIARRLGDPSFRERLLACETGESAISIWG